MFRRGFRLHLPPIFLTFCEMRATRFGFGPPLNFNFVAEHTFWGQVLDWLGETNRFVNPVFSARGALRGFMGRHKYDPVVWTIPLEFYGSVLCYGLLLVVVWIPSNAARMGMIALFSSFCMVLGSWNMFCFSAGMLIADFNLGQEEEEASGNGIPCFLPITRFSSSSRYAGKIWMTIFALGIYMARFPTIADEEAKLNPMPGLETLRSLIPMNFLSNMEDQASFLWSISGVSLLLSISQLPRLKELCEKSFCQYLGKISFSLYLVHEFCLVLFGSGLQGLLMEFVGLEPRANTILYWGVCVVWYGLFTVAVFALAKRVEVWVDGPSFRFASWLEGKCVGVVEGWRSDGRFG